MPDMQNELLMEEAAPSPESDFFKKMVSQFLILWPWLLLSSFICVSLAYVYLRYNTPEYKIHASVLVKDDKNGSDGGDVGLLQDFGLLSGKSNVDNEVEIFKSWTLMKRVVEDQQLFVTYFIPGKVKATEILNSPVTLRYIENFSDSLKASAEYNLTFNQTDISKFNLSFNDKSFKGKIGDTLQLGHAQAIISPTATFYKWPKSQPIIINVVPVESAVRNYMSRLTVMIPNKLASIISLTLNEVIPQKGEMVLNSLINAYLQANVNDKSKIADSTIRFIDDRLLLVFKELSSIEKDIEGFKTVNKITSISDQSRLLLENTSDYSKQLNTQEVQLAVVEALELFLKNNQNNSRIVPSSLVMQDPSFIALIQRYNEMQLQRDKMLMVLKNEHPSIITIDEQLKNVREELSSSINSVKKGIEVGVSELKKRTSSFESQISKVPAKERVWLDYERQQAIKQELYLFLLKKREETAISKSSTLANARIIDAAKADAFPFKPIRKNFLTLGIIVGILIPFGILFIKNLLNNKVNSLEDITNATNTPILGEIGHNIENTDIAVTLASRSVIAEQFRALRTNINFLLTGVNDKVILITSSMSGEGKSFLSINLSLALALSGKKVILLELDLRKPKISEILRLQRLGITNYLIEHDSNWQKWLQSFGVDAKFDVFSSGPLPPNPAELLMLPQLTELIKELRNHYDYIIIDSAPVGLVTDAQVLASLADVTLYVVRHNLTYKQQVVLLDRLFRKRSLPRLNIVVNDVKVKKVGYGYDKYGYGDGYGYGNEIKGN
jgi:capsular exopolysaccharide synthesis family protein